jgi:hypothetical protein
MIEVVNKTYTFMTMLFRSNEITEVLIKALQAFDMVPHWNQPQLTTL